MFEYFSDWSIVELLMIPLFIFVMFICCIPLIFVLSGGNNTELPDSHYKWMDTTEILIERADAGDTHALWMLNNNDYSDYYKE